MKLTKINYGSAVFFGVLGFVSVFLLGLAAMISTRIAIIMQMVGLTFKEVIYISLTQGISAYVGIFFSVLVYNLIAKKYPISWTVKK